MYGVRLKNRFLTKISPIFAFEKFYFSKFKLLNSKFESCVCSSTFRFRFHKAFKTNSFVIWMSDIVPFKNSFLFWLFSIVNAGSVTRRARMWPSSRAITLAKKLTSKLLVPNWLKCHPKSVFLSKLFLKSFRKVSSFEIIKFSH